MHTDRVEKVDRYGELRRQIKLFAPIREEYEALTKEILSWYDDDPIPAHKTDLLEGSTYDIQVSARENKSEIIDYEKVYRALGRQLFIELAYIELGDLRRVLRKEQWERFILTSRSGRRRLEPVLKAPAAGSAGKAA